MQNYMPYGIEFNKDVINDLSELNKEIEKESKETTVDKDKLLKLRMQRLYRGIELNSGYYRNNYRAMFPY